MEEKELFLKKFEEKLKKKLDKKIVDKLSNDLNKHEEDFISDDYEQFRIETLPSSFGMYEKICYYSEKLLNIAPDKKSKEKIDLDLFKAHLNISAKGVMSAALLSSIIFIFSGILMMIALSQTIGFGFLLIGLGLYFAMQKIPSILAKRLKAKANDEVIIAVFYIVAFMRFSSNFELAVNFAANYLSPPLSLDFKRILWELQNSKYSTVKKAFDNYLESWRDENLEFLEAIYLIESSLYESEEFRRISLLDKSLDIILQGNFEKMLHFAQDLRGKVQTFNMIGVVLPILGLIILPLAASFGDPRNIWEIVFLLYNILIPVFVGYFGFMIIFNRPSSVNSIKAPKNLKNQLKLMKCPIKITSKKTLYLSPKIPAFTIFLFFLLIGLSPILLHITGLDNNLNLVLGNIFDSNSSPFSYFSEYKMIEKETIYSYGPYGIFPAILSLFIPISIAFGIGYYFRYKYQNLVHIRDKTKELEKEFPSATFQLGNRINEGISAELAFGAVAETMKGTEAGVFFSKIDSNIKFDGLSVERAIFDSEKGAINTYPSDLVISSMKILIRAIENGPDITAKTLVDLSKYLTEIHLANERMSDLLGESLSSMKGQASFLAPIISGVVVSIVSLVTMILGTLAKATNKIAAESDQTGAISGFLGDSIPTYLFQSVVGIYMVFLIIVLVYMVTNLESGEDIVNTRFQISQKVIKGILKYSFVVAIGSIGFAFIGSNILSSLA